MKGKSMEKIVYRQYGKYNENEIMALYGTVGWTNYTSRPEMLKAAYENSLLALGAYCNERLVGIIRLVGDAHSIIYIQDIVVLPEYQRRGIGGSLLRQALGRYPNVYQTVLLTDSTAANEGFYKSLGFAPAGRVGCMAFVKMGL